MKEKIEAQKKKLDFLYNNLGNRKQVKLKVNMWELPWIIESVKYGQKEFLKMEWEKANKLINKLNKIYEDRIKDY